MIVQGLYYESDDPSFVATVVKMIDHSFGWRGNEHVVLVFGIDWNGHIHKFGMLENSWTRLI